MMCAQAQTWYFLIICKDMDLSLIDQAKNNKKPLGHFFLLFFMVHK